MTQITSTDQVLLLLRAHLERTRKSRTKKPPGASKGRGARPTRLERVQTVARSEELSDEDIQRSIIAGMLTDEFGAGAANDANFQKMVDDILRVIARDEKGQKLLAGAIRQLLKGDTQGR